MIDSPNSNISLTFEELAQIETTKSILSNLENEITIANKNLNIIAKEVLKATKERDYQEELILTLSEQVSDKQAETLRLDNSISQMKSSLEESREREGFANKILADKTQELRDRENKISEIEKELSVRKAQLEVEMESQLKDREDLNIAYDAFKDALTTITWKFNKE